MTFNREELQEILSIYKSESDEHLQRLGELLLELEKTPDKAEALEEIFREAHSLKGSARMIGFATVEKIAHGMEDLFSAVRKGELKLSRSMFDVIFESLNVISAATQEWLKDPESTPGDTTELLGRIDSVRAGKKAEGAAAGGKKSRSRKKFPPERAETSTIPPAKAGSGVSREKSETETEETAPPPTSPVTESGEKVRESAAPGPKIELEETIRVTTQKLDSLMSQIGEIIVTKIKFDQRLSEVRSLESEMAELHRGWTNTTRQMELQSLSDRNGDFLPADAFKGAGDMIARIYDDFSRFVSRFNEDSLRMTLISGELQESINRVRMLPLSSLFNLFPRLLRDVLRSEGKEAEMIMEGGEIQLDKRILEELKDPLMHLLRNAIDHGIESPAERVEAGKSPSGTIWLRAHQKASSVLIEVSDNGAGLDMDKIRSTALRRGVVTEEQLAEMTETQVMGMVFRPGFSTKGIITDLSGRGVGLDVVYNRIERLKGSISLASEKTEGSTFAIKLPVSLATSMALLVRVGDQVFTIPLTAVETITEIVLGDVMTVESREAILVEGVPTALVRLQELMNMEGDVPLSPDEKTPVVVVGSTEEQVALIVSEVIGEKEIVVKGLGPQLRRVKNISGATILGDGSVVLILNVFDIIKSSQKVRGLWAAGERKKAEEQGGKPEILVADDSVTTRVLEKNILEGSGYRVTLAVDGADALQRARSQSFDLVVSDVEMPRMNGFELTRELRRDTRFSNLPIILVTSLDSEEHKREGIEAGADAYITKGNFEQGNLLSTIKQLL